MAFSRYEHSPKKLAEFVATYEEISSVKNSPAPVKEVATPKPVAVSSGDTILLEGPEAARYLRVSERSITGGRVRSDSLQREPQRWAQ